MMCWVESDAHRSVYAEWRIRDEQVVPTLEDLETQVSLHERQRIYIWFSSKGLRPHLSLRDAVTRYSRCSKGDQEQVVVRGSKEGTERCEDWDPVVGYGDFRMRVAVCRCRSEHAQRGIPDLFGTLSCVDGRCCCQKGGTDRSRSRLCDGCRGGLNSQSLDFFKVDLWCPISSQMHSILVVG